MLSPTLLEDKLICKCSWLQRVEILDGLLKFTRISKKKHPTKWHILPILFILALDT
jgi:hypothetical protein